MGEVDAFGETLLHTAARSKAAGFSRLFIQAQLLRGADGRRPEASLGVPAPRRDRPGPNPAPPGISGAGARVVRPRRPAASAPTPAQPPDPLRHRPDDMGQESLAAAAGAPDLALLLEHAERTGWRPAVDRRGWGGNTPLHAAAASGNAAAVELLLQAGADPKLLDEHQRTPLDLARNAGFGRAAALLREAGGHTGVAHARPTNRGASPPPAGLPAADGGWGTRRRDPATTQQLPCPLDRISAASLEHAEFERVYVRGSRPVIIEGALEGWEARQEWARDAFVAAHGDVRVQVATMPYASTYNASQRQRTARLDDFVQHSMGQDAAGVAHSDYVFDAQVLQVAPRLAAAAPMPAWVAAHPSILKQFIMGPLGTGAYPHYHNAAANALVYGQKRWWLFPPGDAFFDFRHISTWIRDALPAVVAAAAVGNTTAYECVQRAGEVMFVPELWGHGVLNEMDSVGVAFEFHGSSV